ncbi:hypothetical protein [Candidatus Tisiphia endosymbiont of Oplodontha viridula]|uniref:hypothetical protein n=1 Tax=Candidatus Tisiphia endosymbiont of Oplodontha viridula TaxID=3077925 RepID=UPI0035C8A477
MKTVLPERSLIIQERLDNIVKEILAVSKHKIAMIILFGSYARGDWVQDEYKKGHITYSYQSDLVKKFNFLSHTPHTKPVLWHNFDPIHLEDK